MNEIDQLARLLAKLPGLGPRSAQRAVLHMLQHRDDLMSPLGGAIGQALANVKECEICGNLDTTSPCHICTGPGRDHSVICVVETVADLWALERSHIFQGMYHVLGGVLSPLEGIRPEDLAVESLLTRAKSDRVQEAILALGATVEGQTTCHYLTERLSPCSVKISRLAHGLPVGGSLDYLDEGTLAAALSNRKSDDISLLSQDMTP